MPDKKGTGLNQQLLRELKRQRQTVFQRFPMLFTLLTTFGVVATLYGFEGIINQIPLLADNPVILLSVGIITLGLTGTLYRKLSA
jgi:hypothetical protein